MALLAVLEHDVHRVHGLIDAPDGIQVGLRPVDVARNRAGRTWLIQAHEAFVALFPAHKLRIQLMDGLVVAHDVVFRVDHIGSG